MASWRDVVAQQQATTAPVKETPAAAKPPAEPSARGGWRDAVKEQEPSVWATIKDLFTGESKETEATQTLPEGVQIPFDITSKEQAKAALGTMLTWDPKRKMTILLENFPDLKFDQDEKGNIIVDASAYDGGVGVLNKPGMSIEDIIQLGGQAAMLTPAARLGVGAGVVGGATRVGAGGAAAEAAMDIGSQYFGGVGEGERPGVQVSDIDPTNVALGFAGGAGGEIVSRGLMMLGPLFKKVEVMPLDNSTKQAVSNALEDVARQADDLGIDPSPEMITQTMGQYGIPQEMATSITQGMPVRQAAEEFSGMATEQSRRFGIPYSEGQRTGRPATLQFEESARGGAMGETARDAAENLARRQETAIPEAIRREGGKIGGETPLITDTIQAAEDITQRVQTLADAKYKAVQEAYESVPKGTFFNTQGLQGIIKGIKGSVRGLEFDRTLTGTSKAFDDLAKMEKTLKVLSKTNARMPFQNVEKYRRKLAGYIAGADDLTDKRQLVMMRDALDEYTDTAVADGLLFGDVGGETLEAMKNARSLRREYSELFEPQTKKTRAGVGDRDAAGRLINKMAELEPSPDEVANALFSSGNAFGKNGSAQFANKLKTVLGEDSPEWNQVKQAAFLKVFGVDKGQLSQSARDLNISGTQALNRMQEIIGGRGKTLGKELFSKQEIEAMLDLARAIKRAQPEPFNPSGSGNQAAFNMLNSKLGRAFRMFNMDPVSGAVLGAVEKGSIKLSEGQSGKIATELFSGRPLQKLAPSVPVETVAIPAVVGGQQEAAQAYEAVTQ